MSEHSGVTGKTPFQVARALGADERKARRAERAPQEQLSILDRRPGKSVKERRRLLDTIAKMTATNG